MSEPANDLTRDALTKAEELTAFDDGEEELIRHSLGRVRNALTTIKERRAGQSGVFSLVLSESDVADIETVCTAVGKHVLCEPREPDFEEAQRKTVFATRCFAESIIGQLIKLEGEYERTNRDFVNQMAGGGETYDGEAPYSISEAIQKLREVYPEEDVHRKEMPSSA